MAWGALRAHFYSTLEAGRKIDEANLHNDINTHTDTCDHYHGDVHDGADRQDTRTDAHGHHGTSSKNSPT